MHFGFRDAGVDCLTVGYKAASEIDEAIENLNLAPARWIARFIPKPRAGIT
jgi:hypothetical protein